MPGTSNFTLKVTVDTTEAIKNLNVMLANLRTSLGKFGGADIKLLDEKAIQEQFGRVSNQFAGMANSAKKSAAELSVVSDQIRNSGSALGKTFQFNQITQAVSQVTQSLQLVAQAGIEYEKSLAAVGAITGLSGEKLEVLGQSARGLAIQFGTNVNEQLLSFQGILSKLGPAIGNNPAALELMAKNINTLAAAGGISAADSMNVITDSMLQLGLVTGDAMKDAETSTRVINSIAASAQVGAAEINQVQASLVQAGTAAKGANIGLDELNAEIQVLALGGKTGSEAGVSLRNVMGLLQNASGPAAAELQKMGLTSKELGETLTKEGLNEAMTKIKNGMSNFGSDAEKNAALIKIFGVENATAAGILINNTDKYQEFVDGIKAGQNGMGSAFEQAATNMDTASTTMGKWQAVVNNAFIGLSQAMGQGLTSVVGFAGQMQPLISSIAGLGSILPTESIKKFSTAILNKLIPGLITTAATQTGVAVATEGATAAQTSFNAAALLNPYVAGIALLIAATVAISALSKALHDNASEKLEDAKAEDALLDAQIKNTQLRISNTQKLQKSGDDLISAFGKEGTAAMENTALMTKLNMAFPGVIDSTKSAAENFEKLKKASANSSKEVEGLKSELSELALAKVDLKIQTVRLETNKIKEGMEDTLTDALVSDKTWLDPVGKAGEFIGEVLFDSSTSRKQAEKQMKTYTDAIYKASTDEDIIRAGQKMQLAISKGTGEFGKLKPEQKQELINQTQDLMNNEIKLREEKAKKIESLVQQQLKMGLSEVEVAEMLKNTYGKTPAEIEKIIGIQKTAVDTQKDLTKEVDLTAKSAADLGAAFDESMKTAKQSQAEAIGALSELNKQRREGNISETQYQQLKSKQVAEGKAATKTLIQLGKDQKAATDAIAGVQQKAGETAYQLAKRQLDAKKSEIDQSLKQYTIMSDINRLNSGREKGIIDEIALQDKKTKSLEEQKQAFKDIFQLVTDEKGNVVSIGVAIGKNEKKAEIFNDIKKQWNEINNSFGENDIAALEIRAKIKTTAEELDKQLVDLQEKQFEFEVSLGLKTDDDILNRTEQKLLSTKSKIQDINNQIASLQDSLKAEPDGNVIVDADQVTSDVQDLTKQLYTFQSEEIDLTQKTSEIKQKIHESDFTAAQELNAKYLTDYENRLNAEKDLQNLSFKVLGDASSFAANISKENQLKALESKKQAELITEASYNSQKEQIEADYQTQIKLIQESIRAAELEAERQHTINLLTEKQKRLESEQALLDPVKDKSKYDELGKQIEDIATQVKDKGDLLKEYSVQLQTGLNETFSNLFGGNLDGAKENAKKLMSFFVGIMKKQASMLIAQKVMETLFTTPGGIWALLAAPVIFAGVSALVNAIIDPIVANVMSFATGGRVDEPTLAVVGDAKNARRGSNTEWILRDDQLTIIMNMVLVKHLGSMNKVIAGLFPEYEINPSENDLSNKAINKFGQIVDSHLTGLTKIHNSLNRISSIMESLPENLKGEMTIEKMIKISVDYSEMENLNQQFKMKLIPEDDYFEKYAVKQKQIKSYAGGSGFLYSPELAMVGDAGVNNPEIVLNSPQLKDLIENVSQASNSALLKEMSEVKSLLAQLVQKDPNIYMDSSKVTDEIQREMNRRKK